MQPKFLELTASLEGARMILTKAIKLLLYMDSNNEYTFKEDVSVHTYSGPAGIVKLRVEDALVYMWQLGNPLSKRLDVLNIDDLNTVYQKLYREMFPDEVISLDVPRVLIKVEKGMVTFVGTTQKMTVRIIDYDAHEVIQYADSKPMTEIDLDKIEDEFNKIN